MGWMAIDIDHELAGKHEGYVVGSVSAEDGRLTPYGRLRELHCPADPTGRSRLVTLQAGCDCGWRSPHEPARDARWSPFAVFASDEQEEAARKLWREHVDAEARRAVFA